MRFELHTNRNRYTLALFFLSCFFGADAWTSLVSMSTFLPVSVGSGKSSSRSGAPLRCFFFPIQFARSLVRCIQCRILTDDLAVACVLSRTGTSLYCRDHLHRQHAASVSAGQGTKLVRLYGLHGLLKLMLCFDLFQLAAHWQTDWAHTRWPNCRAHATCASLLRCNWRLRPVNAQNGLSSFPG